MMRLRSIHEGWSLDLSDLSLQDVQGALQDKGAARALIGDRAKFRDEDYINDLIRVVPFNRAERLNTVDNSVQSQQTQQRVDRSHHGFQTGGGKIYYGFTFATKSDGYRDRNIGVASDLARQITFFKQHKQWLEQAINDPASINLLRSGKMSNPITNKPYRLFGSNPQERYQTITAWCDEIDQQLQELKTDWMKQRDDVIGPKGSVGMTDDKEIGKYLHSLKYAFADALKHPSTPKGEKARDSFIQNAATNFIKQHRNDYDIITFPESSSDFNTLLAQAIANGSGAQIMQGFEKKLVKNVTVDDKALGSRYDMDDDDAPADQDWQRMQNHLNPKNVDKDEDLPDSQRRRSETDREREVRKLKQSLTDQTPKGPTRNTKKIEIKRVASGDKRRYLDFLNTSNNLDMRGKRVLVVDDNVAHSGTMERIFLLAQRQQPAVLDLYTPLYMGKS